MNNKNTLTIIITLLFFLVSNNKIDAQNFEWAKQIGGVEEAVARGVASDNSGNIYFTGKFRGTVDFDAGLNTHNLTSYGGSDVFVCKMDSRGNFLWVRQMGSSISSDDDTDNAYSVDIDRQGNVIVTGSFIGEIEFGPENESTELNSTDGSDIFVAKLDSAGNLLWARQFGGVHDDRAFSIIIDINNYIYLSGVEEYIASENSNFLVLKLNSDGELVWERKWPNSHGYSFAVDQNGNVYITGHFWETVDFDPGLANYNLSCSCLMSEPSKFDVFISKLDADGNFVWAKQIKSESYLRSVSIVSDKNGNTYITGLTLGSAEFISGSKTFELYAINLACFVLKLNPKGEYVWAKGIKKAPFKHFLPTASVLDNNSNLYITGYFDGEVDFDPDSTTATYTSNGFNIFVTKLDSAGNFKWASKLSHSNSVFPLMNYSYDVEIDRDNSVYITGIFAGDMEFGNQSAEYSFSLIGETDIFILKLSQPVTIVRDNYFNTSISYYPNPTTGILNIELEKVYPKINASLNNMVGQEIFSEVFYDVDHFQLSLDGITSGIYFIYLTDKNEQKKMMKVVKE